MPRGLGKRAAVVRISDSAPGSPRSVTLSGIGTQGYYLAGVSGSINALRRRDFHGSLVSRQLSAPIISMTTTPSGAGYWLLGSDGGIFSFGTRGSSVRPAAMQLNRPVVGMAATTDGQGYWLVAGDGGIFSFGDARVLRFDRRRCGSTSRSWAWRRRRSGKGYWLVASDGGIFTFGDARFFGSTGAIAPEPADRGDGGDAVGQGLLAGGVATAGSSRSATRGSSVRPVAAPSAGSPAWP